MWILEFDLYRPTNLQGIKTRLISTHSLFGFMKPLNGRLNIKIQFVFKKFNVGENFFIQRNYLLIEFLRAVITNRQCPRTRVLQNFRLWSIKTKLGVYKPQEWIHRCNIVRWWFQCLCNAFFCKSGKKGLFKNINFLFHATVYIWTGFAI